MSDLYSDELNRRIAKFAAWLEKMGRRRRRHRKKGGEDDCYIIFDESWSNLDAAPARQVKRALALVEAGGDTQTGQNILMPPGCDAPDGEDDDLGDKFSRFVQFCFGPKLFFIDLPNTTLCREEGERIIRDRPGFFWGADNPVHLAQHNPKPILEWTPLVKYYLYGDEMRAAEDMAYIFFQLWKFPLDWRFFVTARFFEGPDFEAGAAIE